MTIEPPESCDICSCPITHVFIDGRTTLGGWANMCITCYCVTARCNRAGPSHGRAMLVGFPLGCGSGQRYEKQDDGRWVKTEG